ncbi:phenylacetate--CoA ligase family protein [Massilia sp. BJB1822]|uniref:phenylacetate--CoA ligase family protein n=1 Tax=Massilia sp. BJB1822 TaxID=2744470 RepID=UPI001593CE50|nr:phenylacetate--CoA ligase family protein [Massilia sp. BJB1822]NVD99998.1 phenylacetate--CoA ligase family protein [Massilia sp. BJB1822]
MKTVVHNELHFGGRSLLRENAYTRLLLQRLRRHESMPAEQLQELGRQYLYRSLQRAVRLPAYRALGRDFAAHEAEQVLRAFPLVDKMTLLRAPELYYPHGGRRLPWQSVGKTSGTTGTPLSVVRSCQSVLMEQAFIRRHWAWAGFGPGLTRATLRGDMVADVAQTRPPFWFWNRYERQLLLSARHLSEPYIDAIMARLAQARPYLLQAYPSTAYTLALYLAKRGRRLPIPYVFTASEPMYPHQRELILDRFGCRIMDMYGMAERVAFATECEYGALHVNPDYGHVEIVDERGRPTADVGFVVGTSYHNLAMPLVRYRLSDRTRWKPGRCACGRAFPMIEPVSGKFEDAITGSDGQAVSPSVLTFAFKGVEHIDKSQVAQVGAAQWEIRLVPDVRFSELDREKLLRNVRQLVDAHVAVRVVLTSELPNTAMGKFRWVVNEMR